MWCRSGYHGLHSDLKKRRQKNNSERRHKYNIYCAYSGIFIDIRKNACFHLIIKPLIIVFDPFWI